MKLTIKIAAIAALSLVGTACATKKYVAQTVAPIDARVTGTETKNTEQDKQIAEQAKNIEELDRGLSRTREQLKDTDSKAIAAGDAAAKADQKADGAWKAADGAKSLAQQGLDANAQLAHTVDAMNKYQVLKAETVLFAVNHSTLTDEAKAQLDELAKASAGLERFVIEVQGFTDKTGTMEINERLSQARAQEVARYLANEHKIPVRSISLLGSGYAQPVADDKTREGRKLNRRVEIRLYVPEATNASKAVAARAGAQQ
ncbi:MAG TPA: OmpA family protein [Bryobacteraceae bacterium]|nr:OmpA family protein [Bryobacteraceae bacterium]